jgi:hypothetical protein
MAGLDELFACLELAVVLAVLGAISCVVTAIVLGLSEGHGLRGPGILLLILLTTVCVAAMEATSVYLTDTLGHSCRDDGLLVGGLCLPWCLVTFGLAWWLLHKRRERRTVWWLNAAALAALLLAVLAWARIEEVL